MERSFIQLNDLPDEILLILLKNLQNAEVLYSLINVNKRLTTIVNDSNFTKYLTLRTFFSNGLLYEFTRTILDRFCLEILPKIQDKIEFLNLESSSMKRILLLTSYPNLYGIGLYDIATEIAKDLFTDESFFIRTFKNQISSLTIDINKCQDRYSILDSNRFIYTQVFTMFRNLKYFNFGPSSSAYHQLSFGFSPPSVFSSTLLELHILVDSFKDCLYLLDGRFSQLHTFYVTICDVSHRLTKINNEVRYSY
ncbi:unnamed protein product [Rotaria socialis]|uniref:F-box domain-containing protein n=1 Tax=Rotaria socialis TaxID=392032 RepID=A0A818VBT3_9BILA|nr:unnamed protein product [Rotaria socialis]